MKSFGMPGILDPLPAVAVMFRQFWVNAGLNEVLFHYSHRLLHWRPLYKRIHKQHHKYIGTIGFAAEYAHPVEQLLANQGPTIIGSIVQGVHPLILLVWLAWRLENTYEGHSGYCFKGTLLNKIGLLHANQAPHHDFHHTHNVGCYSSIFWDWVDGTLDAREKYTHSCTSTHCISCRG